MIQFHDFGIDIQTYTDRGKENDFPDVNQCPHVLSRRPLRRHGYYQRYALTAEGEYHLWIARYARENAAKP
ncbi:hypothetical protein EP10_001591 [Geobacillus icigianus]|uniref:Uncharacterized protein n=1 Tax=Geobacillus icigianus TaxID=1430331 RepID=A0ABU6BG03_9BACL|nr:hypothetical protein [Geobacillus icigianus]